LSTEKVRGRRFSFKRGAAILQSVRLLLVSAAAILAACAPEPRRSETLAPDPTREAWFGQAVEELAAINRDTESLLRHGKTAQAAANITNAQPLMSRLLAVPRPTLAATEAVSDLDHLYGSMLLKNRNYGWARLFFQKNVARWRNWTPRTEETARRLKLAESLIAECDRNLAK
jgi:hypothetical protein